MYFENFPDIYYEFEINGVRELKVVKDVTNNIRLRKAILENIALYDEYDIKDGETPEIISHKVYGSSLYHWVIMICNNRYDYIEDFPKSMKVLDDYIKNKYTAPYDIHHYELNGFVVNQGAVDTSTGTIATSVTNYEYEDRLNESKRRIKLISPGLLGQILRQFKELI